MRKLTDTTMEEDILEIYAEYILIELLNNAISPFPMWLVTGWLMEKSAICIAEENEVELDTVYAKLKELEKAIIEVSRISRHEE